MQPKATGLATKKAVAEYFESALGTEEVFEKADDAASVAWRPSGGRGGGAPDIVLRDGAANFK